MKFKVTLFLTTHFISFVRSKKQTKINSRSHTSLFFFWASVFLIHLKVNILYAFFSLLIFLSSNIRVLVCFFCVHRRKYTFVKEDHAIAQYGILEKKKIPLFAYESGGFKLSQKKAISVNEIKKIRLKFIEKY